VRRSYRPLTGVLVRNDTERWLLDDPLPGKMAEPGLVMFWFGSDLFYANAGFFTEQVRRLVKESPTPVRWLVIDARAVTGVDFSAGQALKELHQDLAKAGVTLAFIVVQVRPNGDLERMGILDAVGTDRIFDNRHACLEAYRLKSASDVTSLSRADVT